MEMTLHPLPHLPHAPAANFQRRAKVQHKRLAAIERNEVKTFIVKGKPDFSDLNLSSYNWKRINKPSFKEKQFMENTPGYKDYKETIIYEGPQGKAIVQANYRKDQHKVAIYLNNPDDPLKMEAVKFMFQSEWGYQLKEVRHQSLIDDIKSN